MTAGVFDSLNQAAKGPAPALEQKPDDRYRLTGTYTLAMHAFKCLNNNCRFNNNCHLDI